MFFKLLFLLALMPVGSDESAHVLDDSFYGCEPHVYYHSYCDWTSTTDSFGRPTPLPPLGYRIRVERMECELWGVGNQQYFSCSGRERVEDCEGKVIKRYAPLGTYTGQDFGGQCLFLQTKL